MLKTAASGRGFQHLPRDLANVNAWKIMFDPYYVSDQTIYLRWLFLIFNVCIYPKRKFLSIICLVNLKTPFEHPQNAQIQKTLRMHNVSSGYLFSINNFSSI